MPPTQEYISIFSFEEYSLSDPKSQGLTFKYRIHWHVWLIHFPISLFLAAFIFQILHLVSHRLSGAFEVSGNIMLIAATILLIPATWTGWFTWHRQYNGVQSTIFIRKSLTAYAMLAFSIAITVWRAVFLPAFEDIPFGLAHWFYLFATILLMFGAILEGFYGIRLNHK